MIRHKQSKAYQTSIICRVGRWILLTETTKKLNDMFQCVQNTRTRPAGTSCWDTVASAGAWSFCTNIINWKTESCRIGVDVQAPSAGGGARAPVPHSWRRQWVHMTYCITFCGFHQLPLQECNCTLKSGGVGRGGAWAYNGGRRCAPSGLQGRAHGPPEAERFYKINY